ncbi:transposase [Belnapia rosea]|uniref:transposase n=1 Tax=Belnapia rosea TaxID=938405 RepID=UPI00088A430D|nr:transposase [Belnapia rosea]SDB35494.1 Putative transposase of IS4/5 family [Belnapia rosea]
MPLRRRRRRIQPDPIPVGIFPADLVARHDLFRRLYLDPLTRLTPPRPWAPMTDAEWRALAPILAAMGCGMADRGRPMDCTPRARLDAIFHWATTKHGGGRAPWRILPAAFGKPDTVSRCWRRWARAGLWPRLLLAVALHPERLASLAHRICCAFRRAIRLCGGLHAIVLARRLGLFSALPAPSQFLPDPDLSEIYRPIFRRFAESFLARPWYPPRIVWRTLHSMHRMAGGRARITRWMEPA